MTDEEAESRMSELFVKNTQPLHCGTNDFNRVCICGYDDIQGFWTWVAHIEGETVLHKDWQVILQDAENHIMDVLLGVNLKGEQ